MKNPLVSIITPVYYGEDTLERAIRSVLKQDFPDWEMIIISDDRKNYEKIVQKSGLDDRRLRFTSTGQIGSGESNARNKGLDIARGQYISCLDCDDAFKPQKLSTLIPLVKKYGAAISSIEYRDSKTNLLLENLSKQPNTEFITPTDVFHVCFYTASMHIYDRSKIELYYDVDLPAMPDGIFLMSFFNTIETIGYCQEPLHIYYRRENSVCNSKDTAKVFALSKKIILDKLNSGTISIKNGLAKSVTKKHIELKLEMEEVYAEEKIKNSSITFLEFLKHHPRFSQT
ncbi:glycosyltransferase family 2 protein [Roseofilum sp. BLCC_M91]|uniref:Glycosyltransferase family 2 protein n=1 Tax=Roseofilum halophilum BLCC-M91 TaxID=3022259 RepID=A0ABT7BEW3_9CYAN|nr:glycosyltransferase family 2 protein [Roseofilum halophilum]MDJ1177715.1 glycosyltransferase family 2 protein [Roseofilum halophilum BLCC-M91]